MKIFAFIVGSLALLTSPFSSAQWPPETGAKVPGNTLELPTTLKPVSVPLEKLLNQGATLITAQRDVNGPVVTVKKGKQYIMCIVIGAGSGGDQNIATSRCYAMN
ncbi:hypothetical protein EFZ10_11060 [Tatumella sp. TA1]|uniref:hypothetical protein n=1 Tax=Rosenbergiella collisarenosi TaxID=1544695 RepID=UPI0008F82F10|nr:hypothetical protein [Rosenbergiella collisarenosi]MBT0720199.1 hypothetical protein [Rosenbergiella collisarenosi]QGX92122.1 hypothetical protein EFZ10_11060 [Tatumella sp. TA1]